MTMGFRPAPGGAAISLDPDEAAVLRSMAAMLLGLIEEPRADDEFARIVGIGSETEPPKDPVLARLLPDAYTGDAEAAGEFRRYTEDDLRRHKRDNAQALVDSLPEAGGEVVLDLAGGHAWLKALNDVRLALGTRLGVEEETYEAYLRGQAEPADEASAAALHVYEWLGALQDSLVHALSGGDDGGPDGDAF
ncbi:DUF2017 domain-containing protein [Marinactinospora thermotolerans]|uniref:Uncharacterized protein n=1 Tax=Marinactinospora thermotolerans DSM 45154 TaxID=1122192 RepID=A0A1T4Q6C1_9ACTN|nr:DUF2017 domain-containing protein [Marinactinospora thermotolerans]SJZ99234.1 protein of unknown function [Marinactinospora thermotolerans DSM 45154]